MVTMENPFCAVCVDHRRSDHGDLDRKHPCTVIDCTCKDFAPMTADA